MLFTSPKDHSSTVDVLNICSVGDGIYALNVEVIIHLMCITLFLLELYIYDYVVCEWLPMEEA